MKTLKLGSHKFTIIKSTTDSLHGLDDRVERVEFISAQYQSRIESLEKENDDLKDQVTYLKSQSMHNNFIFGGLKEEEAKNLDDVIRKFFVDKFKSVTDHC
jgi:cell division protein FtsB